MSIRQSKGKWLWGFAVVLVFLLGSLPGVCWAADEKTSGKKVNFTVERMDSDHQLDGEKDYFDLRVTPDEALEIQFKVKNMTNQPLTVAIAPAYGQTNDNGVISYQTDLSKKNEDFGVAFPELATVDSPVHLDAKEEKIVSVQIQMPSEPYSGIILGGVYFREVSAQAQQEATEKKKQGLSIHTDYSYLIGVQLSERDDPLAEQVDLLYVKPDQIDGENVFAVMLMHPVSQILSGVQLQGKIYAKDHMDKPLYTAEQKEIRLAPNARFQWQMTLPDQRFKAGQYTLQLEVTAGDEHWTYERVFQVTKEDVQQFNQKNLFVEADKKSKGWIWLLVVGTVLLALIGAVAFAYWRVPKVRKQVDRWLNEIRRLLVVKKGQGKKKGVGKTKKRKKSKRKSRR